jgi:DNA-binding MarR family transcriptional regulator
MDWYDVLWSLERAGDQRLRLSEVAEMLTTSRPNFTRLLDRLESAGLVVRERSLEDRRTVYALITPEGKKLRKKMWAFYEKAIEDVFTSHLSKDEQAAIATGLRKVYLSLRDA